MNEAESIVLKTAAEAIREQPAPVGDYAVVCSADEIHERLKEEGMTIQDVSFALLKLRDEGMIQTELPTVGEPLDGHFTFFLTDDGFQAAGS